MLLELEHLVATGQFEAAEASARRILAIAPTLPFPLKALAVARMQQGKHAEAIPLLDKAVAAAPSDAELHTNLGICVDALGRIEEAVGHFSRAVTLAPDDPVLFANYATALSRLGKTQELMEMASAHLAGNLENASAHAALGIAYKVCDQHELALPCLVKAVELSTEDDIDVLHALAESFAACKRFSAALEIYGLLHEHYRINDQDLGWYVDSCLATASWNALAQCNERLRSFSRTGSINVAPFSFLAIPEATREHQLAAAQRYVEVIVASNGSGRLESTRISHAGSLGQRTRIGYLSSDFCEHAVCTLVIGVFETHDRSAFELFAYSHGPDDNSAMRSRAEQAFDVFRDVSGLPDEEVANLIDSDRIDILVDLNGWTARNRLQIMARRPAPIQVTWLGYPGTTGSRLIADYLIGDPVITPPEHAGGYAETLVRMPVTYQPNDRTRVAGTKLTRSEAGLPASGFVFCSFNQVYKINPGVFDLWCLILAAIEGSVLWLLAPQEDVATRNLVAEADKRGIAAERLVFATRVCNADHLGRLPLADLALDTFPYGSHTTGSDALWSGVPMVTLLLDTFPARVGASLLNAVGLPHFVASSPAEYVRIATSYAKDPAAQRRTREALAAARDTSPLFDVAGFTRSLEQLYSGMLQCRYA